MNEEIFVPPRPVLRPPREWTVARLAAFFADRLAVPGISAFFFADLGMSPSARLDKDPLPQAARLLAGAVALAGGVAEEALEVFVASRADLVEACAAALASPLEELRFTLERGVVTVTVQIPVSFLGALKIVLARVREELDEQA